LRWLIYGANGFTGQLIARLAKVKGIDFAVGGRNRDAVEGLARELGVASRVFALDSVEQVAKELGDVNGVAHCAGPFIHTTPIMLAACIARKADYLDITGEIPVFQHVFGEREKVRAAGIRAIPGSGFDVVPTDCVAAKLKRTLPSANELVLAFASNKLAISRGTAKTMVEQIALGGQLRRDGKLVSVPMGSVTAKLSIKPGRERLCAAIPWGDLATAFESTGIPNITVYLPTSKSNLVVGPWIHRFRHLLATPIPKMLLRAFANTQPGPTPEQQANGRTFVYGRVTDGNMSEELRLTTYEGYRFTAESVVATMLRLQERTLAPGTYTPSQAFGPDFVDQFTVAD
jgi:short subunit dehydrogenase-like uncharacterized protein